MQQFIQMATLALGTSEQIARTVTGGLLDLIANNAPAADVSALFSHLPGANDLLATFRSSSSPPAQPPVPPPPPPEPTLLGSLTAAASSMLTAGSIVLGAGSSLLGGGAANLNSLAALLNQQGLDVTKAPQLVAMFAQWLAQQVGSEIVGRTLGAVPGVSLLLGTLGWRK
jgi:hypothetical protein